MSPSIDDHLEAFGHHAVDLVTREELVAKLELGRPLRVKFGCDPSAPDLHLGHYVHLDKLRRLQELGHVVIFLVGDFTGMIGDPTGRSKTRPALTREQVRENAESYTTQVASVLDADRIELRFNSEWMDELGAADFVRLASRQPVARMLERDEFRQRFSTGVSIGIHEFLYPLVQAYDSVALEADVEMGGTDQLFNLLLGREIQRSYGQPSQVVLTAPLLEGIDGVEKMSKSLGNAIGIREAPEEMYGRVMSIPDALLPRWVDLLSPDPAALPAAAGNPRDRKAGLARQIVSRFHGPAAGSAAEDHFDRVFRQHRAPDEVPVVVVQPEGPAGAELVAALLAADFASSRSAARRLIGQGGVRVDDERVSAPDHVLGPGEHLVQAGKRRFARIRVAGAAARTQ